MEDEMRKIRKTLPFKRKKRNCRLNRRTAKRGARKRKVSWRSKSCTLHKTKEKISLDLGTSRL